VAITHPHHRGLWLIAFFKLVKGLLLLAVGIGVLSLLHKDIDELARHWVEVLHVDPENRYIHRLLVKLGMMDDRKLAQISAGTFFYAAVLFTEGIGLMLEKRWAEYLTVVATACLIPIEIYELVKHVTLTRIAVIVINTAIVWYLVRLLARERKPARRPIVSSEAD